MTDAATNAMPILETHGLTMRFGGVVAVDQVDFSMSEGELRCLIGPNGAGKSTFFKCLTHQYKASAGRVRFRGTDITGSHTYQIARRGIGIKTQVPSVFDGLSVHENIWVAARRPDLVTRATVACITLPAIQTDSIVRLLPMSSAGFAV